MTKIICYIDRERHYTCTYDYLDDEQLREVFGDTVIDCEKCDFCKEHKGKEKEEGMIYTAWAGWIDKEYELSFEKDSHDDEI